jgi:hypothetical protein
MINSKSKLTDVQNAGPPYLLLALAPLVLNPAVRENCNDPLNSWTKLAKRQIAFADFEALRRNRHDLSLYPGAVDCTGP